MKPIFKSLVLLTSLTLAQVGIDGAITGQWDFNGNLNGTIGQPIVAADGETEAGMAFGTTATFGLPAIGGGAEQVLKIPKTPPEIGGFYVSSGAQANGGGFAVNQYTIIMDVLFPADSMNKTRALFQTDFFANADLFVTAENGLRALGGSSDGTIQANTWHRIAFAVDLAATPPTVDKFIDGVKVGTQTVGGIDSALALTEPIIFWNDDNDETEIGYINSLQIRDEKLSDGLIAALGGPAAGGILTGPPPNPYIASVYPSGETVRIPSRSTVPPQPEIKIVVTDGESKIVPGSIVMSVDSVTVTPTVRQDGDTTTITYRPTALYEPLSIHRVVLSFTDDATPANQLGTQFSFAVGPFLPLPEGDVLASGTGTDPGFRVRSVQGPQYIQEVNNPNNFPVTIQRGIQQLNGTLRDRDGNLVADEAVAGPNPDGSYDVDMINFHSEGAEVGNFPGDLQFPGIPGENGHNTQFSTEVMTFLELEAGIHRFGGSVNVSRVDVNDDDNYAVFFGQNPRDAFSTQVGAFQNLTGGFPENAQNNNEFTFYAPKAGLYPFRLVFVQGGREASLEWYSVDLTTGEKILINDVSNPNAIRAYRESSSSRANPPYVAELSPRPGTLGNDPSLPVEILIDDGRTVLNAASLQLRFNGAVVTPSVQKTGSRTTVRYQPDPLRTQETNIVQLVYSDNSATPMTFTRNWSFTIAVNSGGASSIVRGQWDFDNGNLAATVGRALEYFDGAGGETETKTQFGTSTSFGIPDIEGQAVDVMRVPGDLNNRIGYTMRHGIPANGGGTLVNQYTLIYDVLLDTAGPGAASMLQTDDLNNANDGDLFWQGNNFGQGQGGYDGTGIFTPGAWHRVSIAVDLAATPPVITKYVDGIKQDDWNTDTLDGRRALKDFAILFADGDADERRVWYVNSIQIREGKLSDAELTYLGRPAASGIPTNVPRINVAGQWDFDGGNLVATVGEPLEYFDGAGGETETKTQFGTTTSFGIPNVNGEAAGVMRVPGDLNNRIGYIMRHGISPNGGGTRVNQYTLIYDVLIEASGPGAASMLQVDDLNNANDGDLFWQGNNFGQGQGGYVGTGIFTPGAWHRVAIAVDLTTTPGTITKYVDGVKQHDWMTDGLDGRRALKEFAILFADGDADERRVWYVDSIQIREGKLSDAQLAALGGVTGGGVPLHVPETTVTGQWDFHGNLAATAGKALEYFDGAGGETETKTEFGTTESFGIAPINGEVATVMKVPGDLNNRIGYIMRHGIEPNGGGTKVNQYTLIYDVFLNNAGPGAASMLQVDDLNNANDGDLFWQGNNFGQGQGGYVGTSIFTPGAWHRVSIAVDLTSTPGVITKFVDGVKQHDWNTDSLDGRRALQDFAILFADGDADERRIWYVNAVQVRAGKLSDAELAYLGGPEAGGIPILLPEINVAGQWDFDAGNLAATAGAPLEYFDGAGGETETKTQFGTTESFGIASISGQVENVMRVPGDLNNRIGYIMRHGIEPNGGGSKVNQYTLIYDVMIDSTGPGAASMLQTDDLNNSNDGDLFWQGNNFGQGQGGYVGTGIFTPGVWHRVSIAVDLAGTPAVITKFVDGVKQHDWATDGLDGRRGLQDFAILFADGDADERRVWYVNSIQIRDSKLSDADLIALGGPSAGGIPLVIGAEAPPPPEEAELFFSVGAGGLTLSWDAELTGFILESTTDLGSNQWAPVAGVSNNSITIQMSEPARFYRLKK